MSVIRKVECRRAEEPRVSEHHVQPVQATLRHTLRGHGKLVKGLAFAPDGNVLAVGSKGTVRLWDTATGKLVRSLSHAADVVAVAYSADGRLVATSELGFPQRAPRAAGREMTASGSEHRAGKVKCDAD